ncbi:MAG: sulfotransferase family protein [Novosphingobium sp.]
MRRRHGLIWHWNRIKTYLGRPRMIVQTKPVVIEDGDLCERPIFIVGAHRSGTSLVRRLFNSHPEIACPPESFFIANYAAMLGDRLVRAGYEAFGYTAEDMRQDLVRKATALHEGFRIATGKRVWADKTPQYAEHLDAIDTLFAGKARFVIVLRHPGDVVHSIYKRDWRFNAIEDGFESALAHVKQSIDALLAFERRNPDRCARIVYCDLCDDPEGVLSKALGRIGMAYDPEMLAFGSKEHNFGLEDPVVRGTRSIQLSNGAWRGLTRTQQGRIVETFGPQAQDVGYWAGRAA